MFILLIASVKFNSRSIQFIHLKCANQHVFVSLIVQPSPQSDSIRFWSPLKESPVPTGRRCPPQPWATCVAACSLGIASPGRLCVWNEPARASRGSGCSRAGSRHLSTWPRVSAAPSFSLLDEVQDEPTSYLPFCCLVDIWVVSTCPHDDGCSGHPCARFRVRGSVSPGHTPGSGWMSPTAPLWSLF